MPASRCVIEIRDGNCMARVSVAGGAILEASVSGVPLLVPSESPGLASRSHGREACFPLIPFGGRIERNGFRFQGREYRLDRNTADPLVLHGDGWLRAWTVVSAFKRAAELAVDVDSDDLSPYAYRAVQMIELLPRGLRLSLTVENRGNETLPFGLGFHPYLPVTAGSTVEFGAGACWSEREMHLPGERRMLVGLLDFTRPQPVPDIWINNAYENWSGRAVVSDRAGHRIILDADPLFGWLMVYKPAGQSGFLCLEPMSHRPNVHDDPESGGLALLEPGQSLSGSIELNLAAGRI